MPKMIAEILGMAAGGYVLLVAGLALFQRDMIYHPGTTLIAPVEAGLEQVEEVVLTTSEGWAVTGWYIPPAHTDVPTVLFFHGNAGTLAHRAHKAKTLAASGYGIYLAGYRGYGGNTGSPSEQGLLADGRAALDWLIGRGVPQSRIVLYGESLGTGIATALAAERPELAALILESPFTRLPALAPPYLLPGLADLLMYDKFDSLSRMKSLTPPLLVVHGERDSLVPPAMGRALLAAAPGIKEGRFLPQAGHNDIWSNGGAEAVLEFLAQILPPR